MLRLGDNKRDWAALLFTDVETSFMTMALYNKPVYAMLQIK